MCGPADNGRKNYRGALFVPTQIHESHVYCMGLNKAYGRYYQNIPTITYNNRLYVKLNIGYHCPQGDLET